MALTKQKIINNMMNLGIPKKDAQKYVETLIQIIKVNFEKKQDLLISNFGKFTVKKKKERKGRNPATGNDMLLEERNTIVFKCSGALKKSLNEGLK